MMMMMMMTSSEDDVSFDDSLRQDRRWTVSSLEVAPQLEVRLGLVHGNSVIVGVHLVEKEPVARWCQSKR